MISRLDDIDLNLKRKIVSLFETNTVDEIIEYTGLSRNEILAILGRYSLIDNVSKNDLSGAVIDKEKIILISDTHLGSELENMKYLDYLYEYATKYGITDILHAGDLFQGTYGPLKKKYRNFSSQIEHFLDDYPYDDNIKNHILFGNHDYKAMEKDSKCLSIINTRKDVNILGFKKAYFMFAKELFSIKHHISKYQLELPSIPTKNKLVGHSHTYGINGKTIYIPTLSDDIKSSIDNYQAGFLVLSKEETINHERILMKNVM